MNKVLFSFFIILSVTFADVENQYLGDMLPDPLHKEDLASFLEEGDVDTVSDSSGLSEVDTLKNIDIATETDSAAIETTDVLVEESPSSKKEEKKKKSRVRKKKYKHRHQVGTALGMMVLITLILSLGGELNPR